MLNLNRISALLLLSTGAMHAQTFTQLFNLDGTNGLDPFGQLVQGANSALYGTTNEGGNSCINLGVYTCGTIFKITTNGMFTSLHSFSGPDGAAPYNGMIQASDGNFYGVTSAGGPAGIGTVFRTTPDGSFSTVYEFNVVNEVNPINGAQPYGGVVQANDGNFYGTTEFGGANGEGIIYSLDFNGGFTKLHDFDIFDGAAPKGRLVQASDGYLYGTSAGGANSMGTIFRIDFAGNFTSVYNFSGPDGSDPVGGLMQATDGAVYGTTLRGGANNMGTVFKMTLSGDLTTLHSFSGPDGNSPYASLIQATDGNFYGTAAQGGTYGHGAVFQITASGALTTLHNFDLTDGNAILAGVTQASNGILYGAASDGGTSNNGVIYSLTLPPSTSIPSLNPGGVVSGASFAPGAAANSWVTIFGTDLSPVTDDWGNAIVDGALPTTLNGVSVSIGGFPACVAFVSPTQINVLAPNVTAGNVSVTVTNGSATSPAVTATAQAVQPAFFLWSNYAVATRQDYSLAVRNGVLSGVTTTPAAPGDVIILWGTGFGPTNPAAPEAMETPSGATYYTASPVTVTVGDAPAEVYGAALAPGFAGLYQVAIQVPAALANGDYPVVATISGASSPVTTLITVQQ